MFDLFYDCKDSNVSSHSNQPTLLFNIDMFDLFYDCKDSNVASHANETAPYTEIPFEVLQLQISAPNFSIGLKITI